MHKIIISFIALIFTLITNAQTVSTVTDGSFSDGLAKDSQGNVYGSDWSGNTVYKLNTNDIVSIFKDGFSNPNGIGINALDEIYICDHTSNVINEYDINGTLITTYSTGLVTPAGIKNIPNTANMLIVEYGTYNTNGTFNPDSSKIKRLNADGTITTLFSGSPLNGPAGISYINDVPYIANFNDRKIFRLENDALTLVAQLPNTGVNNNFIGFLSAIGNILIATQIGEHKIYSIDPNSGTVMLYTGSVSGNLDGGISTATFNGPNGILGDSENDRIYVSDSSTKNLRIIDDVALSVNEFNNTDFEVKIFKSSTSDSMNINISNIKVKTLSIAIFDTLGKTVSNNKYQIKNSDFNLKLNMSQFSSGLNYVVFSSNTKSITKKIVF